MKTICLYHSRDLDGFCSGAIVKKALPQAELIGYDYGQPLPEIPDGAQVIMIDVSLPMKDMDALARRTRLKWIDHHVSAIKDFESYPEDIPLTPVLQNGIAACEIAWRHFFPEKDTPIEVTLLGEYDTWRNNNPEHWENNVLPFQFAMRAHVTSPKGFPAGFMGWTAEEILSYIQDGVAILKYQRQVNERICRNAFSAKLKAERCDGDNDYSCLCLNASGINSDAFASKWDESKYDIMLSFYYNGSSFLVSMYTTKNSIDCSEIAKRFGGGGHRKAAGFKCDNIFDIIKQS